MKFDAAYLAWVAIGLAGGGALGQSVVDLSLNLHYTNAADTSLGGKWYLVAKTNAPHGIAGVELFARHIHASGIVYGNGGMPDSGYSASISAATLGAITNNGQPVVGVFSGVVNLLYGQDTASGPIVIGVGQGVGTPGNITSDPLGEALWNNAALIASGSFGATRPEFATLSGNSTRSNVFVNSNTTPNSNASVMATVITHVRELESLPGDFNFDGRVNAADYVVWRKSGGTWVEYNAWRANFSRQADGDGASGAFADATIPEPSALGLAIVAILFRRRRQKRLLEPRSSAPFRWRMG